MRMRRWFLALSVVVALGSTSLAAPPDGHDATAAAIRAAFGANAQITRDPLSGALRGLFGLSVPTVGATPAERAFAFVATWKQTLDLGKSDVAVIEVRALPGRGHVVRLQQTVLGGIEVEARTLAIKVDADGQIRSVISDVVPFELAAPSAQISADAARQAVRDHYEVALVGAPNQVVLVSAPHLARLAWRVPVAVIPLQSHFFVWVDAESGSVLREAPAGNDGTMLHLPLKSRGAR